MDFLIIGGGCYGSFYTRQLLRGAGHIHFEKIHVVDHDPKCRVFSEYRDASLEIKEKLVFHTQDWKEFLKDYLDHLIVRFQKGEVLQDQYAPPCLAPHILYELFLEKVKSEFPKISFSSKPFEKKVGTPFDTLLPAGTRALSFATWTCPHSCIEPPTCPHTRGPKDWDMKEYLMNYFKNEKLDSLHYFQCLHYTMGVGTIPIKTIVEEYLKFREVVRVPGMHLSAVATISSCHGLVGLVESRHE